MERICREAIPAWTQLPPGAISFSRLSGGLTNLLHIAEAKCPGHAISPRRVLVREYGIGTDLYIDRDQEVKLFRALGEHGIGSRCLATFKGGRVEQFLYAKYVPRVPRSARRLPSTPLPAHVSQTPHSRHVRGRGHSVPGGRGPGSGACLPGRPPLTGAPAE